MEGSFYLVNKLLKNKPPSLYLYSKYDIYTLYFYGSPEYKNTKDHFWFRLFQNQKFNIFTEQ